MKQQQSEFEDSLDSSAEVAAAKDVLLKVDTLTVRQNAICLSNLTPVSCQKVHVFIKLSTQFDRTPQPLLVSVKLDGNPPCQNGTSLCQIEASLIRCFKANTANPWLALIGCYCSHYV